MRIDFKAIKKWDSINIYLNFQGERGKNGRSKKNNRY